ncbi:MAG: hypothetical protein QM479_05360 [Pseudomonadota bacterium]
MDAVACNAGKIVVKLGGAGTGVGVGVDVGVGTGAEPVVELKLSDLLPMFKTVLIWVV